MWLRKEWMRSIQTVANSLKSQQQDEERMEIKFGSPCDNSGSEGMKTAAFKSHTKVVREPAALSREKLLQHHSPCLLCRP